MNARIYTRLGAGILFLFLSGFGWSADIHVPGDYATIQAAIDAAAPGDHIIVAAGNYTEQILINKSLDLTGASEATTTITAPAVRTGNVTQGATVHDYLLAAYATAGTIDVRIEGFTFDLNGQNKTGGTGQIDGVFFRDVADAGGSVAGLFSCTIHNFAAAPDYEGFAVVVYGSSALTIHDNDIHDYTRDGILFKGGSAATVSNNTVTGNASCLNGISLLDGANGTISGNSVSGNTRSAPWAGVGILASTTSAVVIDGNNTIDECWYGICCVTVADITVDGNTLTNIHDNAIVLDNTHSALVTGNTLGSFKATANSGINFVNGSFGNTIGASGEGNNMTMPVAGTGNLRCINVAGSTGSGSNTIQYNTFNGGKHTLWQDGGTSGTTTFAHNTVGNVTSPVTAGLYFDSGMLNIKSNTMTFAGTVNQGIFLNNACVTLSVIGGNDAADGNTITMAASGTGMLYAIQVGGVDVVKSFIIKNNVISGGSRAIQVDGPMSNSGEYLRIEYNTISNAAFGGIVSYNRRNIVISGNTLTANARPIELFNALDVDVAANTINGSTYAGINLGSFTGTAEIMDNVIHDIGIDNNGIWAQAGGFSLDIYGNEIYNITGSGGGGGRGIQINGAAGGANIDGNVIHDISGFAGICIDGGATGVKIKNNDIYDNEQGIVANEPTAQFYGNFIHDNRWGVDLNKSGGTFVLSNNSFVNNNTQPDSYSVGVWDGTAEANCNWWGTLGFNYGNVVTTQGSGAVNITTWLMNGIDADPGTTGFQPLGACSNSLCTTPTDYNFAITPTGTWATHSETLVADACAIYKVTCTPGIEYTFKTGCGDGATAAFDTYIEVYKADGTTLITQNDDGCESYRTKVTWVASQTTAFVKIRGYDGAEFGDYTLAFSHASTGPVACKTLPDFHTEVTPLLGSWLSDGPRSFGSNGCYIYKVNCVKGKEYTFKTGCGNGATASFDTYIEVYDSARVWITGNDDGCSEYWRSIATFTAPNSIAYVKVRGYNTTNYGNFILAYSGDNPAPAACKTIPDNDYTITPNNIAWQTHPATASGTISITSGACKMYEVTGITGNKTYTFKTGCGDNAEANFDTYLELYNSSGVWLAGNDDGCPGWTSILNWTSPAAYTGTVYVKVRGYDHTKTGAYRMAYMEGAPAPPTLCKTPTQFDLEVTPSGSWASDTRTIGSGGCYVYKVNTTATNTYTFMTGCGPVGTVTPTADFDTWIDLYNSAGTLIASNDDGCPDQWRSKIEWTATGTVYYVKVRGWRPDSYGTFTVAYQSGLAPASICPTPPLFDETLAAPSTSFQNGGSDATVSGGCYVYRVAVQSGKTYTFKTGCGDGASAAVDFDTFLELYDTIGGWLIQDDDGCSVPPHDYSSKIVWASNYTGYAYLKIRGWNSEDFGAFTMAYKYATTGPDAFESGTGEDAAANLVKVFPNPANSSFTVATRESLSFTQVTISEFTGRVVRSWSLDQPATSLQIESAGFAQGVYVLSIETSEGWIRKKVSIVR